MYAENLLWYASLNRISCCRSMSGLVSLNFFQIATSVAYVACVASVYHRNTSGIFWAPMLTVASIISARPRKSIRFIPYSLLERPSSPGDGFPRSVDRSDGAGWNP